MAPPSTWEFESLYRTTFPRFLRVALAITREEQAAADAVQEAFARALRSRDSYRGEGSLQAWLWRAVVNEATRAAARRTSSIEGVPEVAVGNGVADPEFAARALIAALPERQRLAVFLRYYADLDYRTIAETLEIEVGTVSATLHAAHASLRTALEGART
jgi:DNA-directed RNA polymerase specialized sigma24 family protein